ncbi:hypothetical protein Dimus_007413, partial [Dionaea muscipula]
SGTLAALPLDSVHLARCRHTQGGGGGLRLAVVPLHSAVRACRCTACLADLLAARGCSWRRCDRLSAVTEAAATLLLVVLSDAADKREEEDEAATE